MAAQTNTGTNTAGLRPAPQRPTKKQDDTALLQVLRDLVRAVEVAEDNDFSESSRKLLAAAADRASELTWNMRNGK